MIDTERDAPMTVEEVVLDVSEEAGWTGWQALAHIYRFIEEHGLIGQLHDYLERQMADEATRERETKR